MREIADGNLRETRRVAGKGVGTSLLWSLKLGLFSKIGGACGPDFSGVPPALPDNSIDKHPYHSLPAHDYELGVTCLPHMITDHGS